VFQLALLLLKDEHAAEAVLIKGLDDLEFERVRRSGDVTPGSTRFSDKA
jgi:hypothetical protein